jgi:hypothetical protein
LRVDTLSMDCDIPDSVNRCALKGDNHDQCNCVANHPSYDDIRDKPKLSAWEDAKVKE